MEQFAHAEGFFHVFIGIHGRDAAAGGSELFVGKPLFFQTIQQNVIRHSDDRTVADFQIVGRDFHALRAQTGGFFVKEFKVDDHAATEHVDDVLAQNSRRKQIQNKFPPFVDHGVPRIVAALITADDVVLRRKQIDHSALAFVAPVDTANRCKHKISDMGCSHKNPFHIIQHTRPESQAQEPLFT